MSDNKNYKLSEQFIEQLARTLQLCLMTGTDITYHLRQFRLQENGEEVVLTKEYLEYFDKMVEKMTAEAEAKLQSNDWES